MPLRIVQVQDGDIRIVDALGNVVSDTPFSAFATEATLNALGAFLVATLDVPLSSRASEATLLTRATEATLLTRATEATLLTRATEATLLTRLSKADFEARINTLGQKTMANSTPIVIASDQSPVSVTSIQSGARTGTSSAARTLGGGTANTIQVLRATTYVEPGSAGQRSVSSSDANDAAAGTGARTIRITYYDNTGAGPFTEDLILNGVTAVDTVAVNIRFIEKMEVLTVGSAGRNIGTISLFTLVAGGGTVIGSIGVGNILAAIGDNQTLWAHHYVAAGSTSKLSSLTVAIQAAGSGVAGGFAIRKQMPLVANAIDIALDTGFLVLGTFQRTFDHHVVVTGFARLTVFAIPGVNNATLAASFDWADFP